MKIARAIRELRVSRALSLSELARRCKGLSKGHLHSVENEKYSPSVLTLIRISEGLDVGVQKLLTLSSVEILLLDPFVGPIRQFLPNLNAQQRQHVLRTLEAAPKSFRSEPEESNIATIASDPLGGLKRKP